MVCSVPVHILSVGSERLYAAADYIVIASTIHRRSAKFLLVLDELTVTSFRVGLLFRLSESFLFTSKQTNKSQRLE